MQFSPNQTLHLNILKEEKELQNKYAFVDNNNCIVDIFMITANDNDNEDADADVGDDTELLKLSMLQLLLYLIARGLSGYVIIVGELRNNIFI